MGISGQFKLQKQVNIVGGCDSDHFSGLVVSYVVKNRRSIAHRERVSNRTIAKFCESCVRQRRCVFKVKSGYCPVKSSRAVRNSREYANPEQAKV